MRLVSAIAKSIIPARLVRHRLNRSAGRAVLLTFDDGPWPGTTPQVLDVLDRWQARAVFFVVGARASLAPDLLLEIIKRGHRIGNHTFSHSVMPSFRGCVAEISRCQETIGQITGCRPDLFRPPRGVLTLPLLRAAMHCKLRTIRWSLDSGEYSYLRYATPEERAEALVARTTARAIILSHDDAIQTPEMLAMALPQLVSRGFDLRSGVELL